VKVHVLLNYDAGEEDLVRVRAVSSALVVEKAARREERLRRATTAEVILAGHWSEELWKAAPRLRWVQSWGAGVEWILTPAFVASPILLTNAQGIYATPIAEHVLGFMLHFARAFDCHVRHQAEHAWQHAEVRELRGSTLAIIGLGGIGAEVARLAKGFGMRVIAVRRRPDRPAPDADAVRGPDALPWLLGESDFVALCAALTPNTRHLIGETELRRMKPTAYLINIGRGELVDEEALIAALRDKRIAGAGLDVFAQEPLPSDSPLWDLPNLLITPHTSGNSPRSHARLMDLFCENLRRYLAGEELLNVVDKAEGY
jgi:phosphoglycerate dehydrogenase-like enzyme